MVVGVVMWCPGACIGPGLTVRWGGFQGSGVGRERETTGGACVGAHWWLRVVRSCRELVQVGGGRCRCVIVGCAGAPGGRVPGGAPSERNESPSIDDGCCGLLTGFFRLLFHHSVDGVLFHWCRASVVRSARWGRLRVDDGF